MDSHIIKKRILETQYTQVNHREIFVYNFFQKIEPNFGFFR